MRFHSRLTAVTVAIVLLLSGVWACQSPNPADSLALVGVRVVPMHSETILDDQTVLVAGGTIKAIGPRESVVVPEGATVIEGAGRYLLPGLIDTHVHFNEREADEHLALYLANGVTTVQSLHGSPRHLELRERVARRELLGPRILTTGPTTAIAGTNSPEKAERLVAEQKAAGYDAIKMYGDGADGMTRKTYHALIEAARREGMRVVGHAPRNHPFSVVLEERQDSIDHMEEIIYTYQPIVDAIGPLLDLQFGRVALDDVTQALADLPDLRPAMKPAVAQLAAAALESGLAVTPTLVAFETIWRQTTPDYPRLLEEDEMRYVSAFTRVNWGPSFNRYRTGWEDRLDAMDKVLHRSLQLQMTILKGFHQAGVPVMVGTDAPLTFVYPGFAVHRELALFVEAGLSPYEALRAATVTPARELRLDDAGSIEVGKRADLLLVEGNPLESIANAGRIAGVVAAGVWMSPGRLDEALEILARAYEPGARQVARLLPLFEQERPEALISGWQAMDPAEDGVAPFVEDLINTLGYRHLGDGEVTRGVEVLRLNVEAFPESANTWDSLGEGLMLGEDYRGALENYRRSLELDPDNENARQFIAWIEPVVATEAASDLVSVVDLRKLEGDYGDRHVVLREGALHYRRNDLPERKLVPIAADTFRLEGLATFRLRFESDDSGEPIKIVGLYAGGRSDESPRDP